MSLPYQQFHVWQTHTMGVFVSDFHLLVLGEIFAVVNKLAFFERSLNLLHSDIILFLIFHY